MLLEVNNLDISYGDKLTVAGANLELDRGEILSIVGESGSGKTTVIRAIMGCLPGAGHVSGGSIMFDGKNILANCHEDWRQMYGKEMSMIFSPKLLLADEPTSALDVTTQAQIIRQIVDVRNEYNAAVIIVTHNLGVASYVSNKIMVMQGGKVVESGRREDIIGNPQHEYTKQLLRAVPVIGGKCYYE